VKPFESVVTLYSGAWSAASTGLWPYSIVKYDKDGTYPEWDGRIVFSDGVGSCVGINSIEDFG